MSSRIKEFGDFQTPMGLAQDVIGFLKSSNISPQYVIEPTCGLGSFVLAASQSLDTIRHCYAYDVNPRYVQALRSKLPKSNGIRYTVAEQDFYSCDWKDFFSNLDSEILVVGNPPWITNAGLGVLSGGNLPRKSNFQNRSGFAAKTGKANFDISEWMLIKLIEGLSSRKATLAMLCKTAVARKILKHAWTHRLNVGPASLHRIDAAKFFGVAVEACLLFARTGVPNQPFLASTYEDLSFEHKVSTFGLVGKDLVSNMEEYKRNRDLDGHCQFKWRSGLKHDASQVMELRRDDSEYINGLGERVELEQTYLYPLLKSSDLASGRLCPDRFVIVTQRRTGDDTKAIAAIAPRTWEYLEDHKDALNSRRSIIYRNRPKYSVFGVGDYAFAPWKVAISGLYKNFLFQLIGEYEKRPIMVDDTCYFVSCATKKEAAFVLRLLDSECAKSFLRAVIFSDAKRPVTVDVLSRIDLKRVAERIGLIDEAWKYIPKANSFESKQGQLMMDGKVPLQSRSSDARVGKSRKKTRTA